MGCSADSSRKWFRENAITVATMIAIVLGVALGFSLRLAHLSPEAVTWISIWGELFLRMVKMIILPLTVCCLVIGVASMDTSASGKLGGMTLTYIFSTHVIAAIIGITLALSIRPGAGFNDKPPDGFKSNELSYTDVFGDLFRNLIPENMIQTCIQTAYTSVENPDNSTGQLAVNASLTASRKLMYRGKMNIMGVVVLSIVFGLSLSAAGEAGRPLHKLMISLHNVIFVMMRVIMWYSPFGIASLIAGAILNVADMANALYAVGLYVAAIIAGCMLHQLIVLPLIYLLVCRKNPFSYMLGYADAVVAGVASTSSAAAMPYLLSALPSKFDLDERVVNFATPIHCSINRDGSLIFVAIACNFCAQSYGIALSVGEITVFGLLGCVMVIAVASVPSSSVMVLIMLSSAFNVPTADRIGLIMAVDWLLDRIRTNTNVVSHGIGVAVIDKFARYFLVRDYTGSDKDVDGEMVVEKFPELSMDTRC